MPSLGGAEVLLLLVVVVLLFGAARLPKLARSMREARQEFERPEEEVARDVRRAS